MPVRGTPEAWARRATRGGTYRGVGGTEVDTDDLLRDDAEGLVGGDAAAHGHRASLEGLAGEAGHADSLTAAGEGLADLHGAGRHGGLSGDTSAHLVSLTKVSDSKSWIWCDGFGRDACVVPVPATIEPLYSAPFSGYVSTFREFLRLGNAFRGL